MKHNPSTSIACRLALWQVTLLFTTAIQANHTNPVLPVTDTFTTPVAQETIDPNPESVHHDLPSKSLLAPRDSSHPSQSGLPCLSAYFDVESRRDQPSDSNCSDTASRSQGLSLKFGRHIDNDAMLGKTDGIRFNYRLGNGLALNSVAGFTVKSDKDTFNPEQQIVGLSADTGTIAKAWDLNAYLFGQQEQDRDDDMAIGGRVRYLQPEKSLLLFLDYNPEQESVNAVMVSSAWQLPRATTLSATIDVRNSPVHSREKKYLQHSMAAVKDWAWILPTERIEHYTRDSQNKVTTLGLSLSHIFSQGLKFSGDMAVLGITGQALSPDTATTSESTSEYYYHVKLTGEDLLFPDINSSLNLHHNVSTTSQTSSAILHTKYGINSSWNITPHLRTDYRENIEDDSVQWEASPAVKMEFRWKEHYGFQVEAGSTWKSVVNADEDFRDTSFFISLDYELKL